MAKPSDVLREVKRAVRDRYAWPGGYPLYVIMSDGETLSCDSVRDNWRQIVSSTLRGDCDGWRVAAVDINWEDSELYCAHSGERIKSAYAEPEDAL